MIWFATLVALLVSLLVWWQATRWYEIYLLAAYRSQVSANLYSYGDALNSAINRRFALLEGLAAFVLARPEEIDDHLHDEFKTFAAHLQQSAPGIRNLTIAPDGIQQYVYPLQGNEVTLGHDLRHDERPAVRAAVERAIQSGDIILSGPYELRQGGEGLVARRAIYVEPGHRFWGLVTMVLDMSPILAEAGLESPSTGLTLALRDGEGQLLFGSEPPPEMMLLRDTIELVDGSWELVGWPVQGWQAGIRDDRNIFQGGGLLIVGLFAGLVYLILSRQYTLADQIRRRTQEVVDINAGLQQQLHERRQVEERLQVSKDRLYQVLMDMPVMLDAFDEQDRIIFWNKECERVTGYQAEEMIDNPEAFSWLYPDPVYRHYIDANWADRKTIPQDWEYEIICRDGQAKTVSWFNTSPTISIPGWATWGVGIDVTERRRAEKALRLTRFAVNKAAEGMTTVSADGRILDANETVCRRLGYSYEELVGMTISNINPDYGPENWSAYWAEIKAQKYLVFETVNQTKQGEIFPVEVSVAYLHYEDFEGYCSFTRDISTRKQLEEQLRQAQKMEAVGQLAGGIAHDFNNLLTAILGYSALLLHRLPDERSRRDLEEIQKAGERAATLTRQLLAFSRQQVLQPKILDLNTIVRDMTKLLRRLIGENVELVTSLAPDLGQIEADPGQMEQVIINLAVNARDAMPQGGKLTIETVNAYLDETYSRQQVGAGRGMYAMLMVSDSGEGMDEATQKRIFEPFFTTKEQGKGTGLGLSTVHGIVKQSGGHILVDSEVGVGTTFKIYLPLLAQTEHPESPAGQHRLSFAGGNETLLLVEDEAMIRTLAQRTLLEAGYQVFVADCAEKALTLTDVQAREIDLLITDVIMPGTLNGRQLAERLTAKQPNLKTLYISGYTHDAVVNHGVLEAELNFLQKPFSPVALLEKVRCILDA